MTRDTWPYIKYVNEIYLRAVTNSDAALSTLFVVVTLSTFSMMAIKVEVYKYAKQHANASTRDHTNRAIKKKLDNRNQPRPSYHYIKVFSINVVIIVHDTHTYMKIIICSSITTEDYDRQFPSGFL